MSSHSRSSSELETVVYTDLLPVVTNDLLKDFSVIDVKAQLLDVIRESDFKFIMEKKDLKEQIYMLLWVLTYSNVNAEDFLNRIRPTYYWIVDKLENECKEPSKHSERFLEAFKLFRIINPTDHNVRRIKQFMKLRRALKQLVRFKYVVLDGDLGIGKKWLAVDVCSEYTVMERMDFKIYWLDVSQCTSPEADLLMLERLDGLVGGCHVSSSPPAMQCGYISHRLGSECADSTNRILKLQGDLREKLNIGDFKNCLLVLVNVQNVKTLKAFTLGCKTLVITRNKNISKALPLVNTTHITIDAGLTVAEFYRLFELHLGIGRDAFPINATDIYYNTNGHPHLLSIIAQSLREKWSDWKEWINNPQKLKTDNKYNKVIEISLRVLSPEELELYATLGIFTHSISIPVKLLAAVWGKTLEEAKSIVHRFHKFSIVTEGVLDGQMVCALPFIYRSYLMASHKIQSMINADELHRKIVNYYRLEETYNQRTEVDLCSSQHDFYFYWCIGYHMRQAGGYTQLFAKIFLDFGFLEQKIRTVKLLHTIADLKDYENEITNFDPRKRQLLRELRDFLPKVEEKLVYSQDTCLLQYALMASGAVYEEAVRQKEHFPNKVWFTEKGNFHQRRQIVNLPNRPQLVRFVEANILLIVLDNNNMLLADISLDCRNGPVYLIANDGDDDVHSHEIVEVRLFRENRYILCLDRSGRLKLWSIADELRRRSLNGAGRRSGKQRLCAQVSPLNFNNYGKIQDKKCKQLIHESSMGKRPIVAFHVEQLVPKYGSGTHLHVAFKGGDVRVFEWHAGQEEFHPISMAPLHTGNWDIRFLSKIFDKYYMILNARAQLSFWRLRDTSQVVTAFKWPEHTGRLIDYAVHEDAATASTHIIFVFSNRIVRLTFPHKAFATLDGQQETLYEYTEEQANGMITCAKLSHDGRYVVLGTKHGLIVFDMHSRAEILRSSFSEAIACVDIHPLDDRDFKYKITCGVENKRALNLYALRVVGGENGSISWAHNVATISNVAINDPQLEPNVWLRGQQLYDVIYEKDHLTLVAVDSKNRIHQVCTTSQTKNWSIVRPPERASRITSIAASKKKTFVGCDNGAIFNLTQEMNMQTISDKPITYLQLMHDNILVAAAAEVTYIRNCSTGLAATYHQFGTQHCFKLFDRYLLLVNHMGHILVVNVRDNFAVICESDNVNKQEVHSFTVAGCALRNAVLSLGTTTSNVHVYTISNSGEKLSIHKLASMYEVAEERITCLSASNDGSLLAVGLDNGHILIYHRYKENEFVLLDRLQSHTMPIYDMKFSPCGQVLVSSSEQMCFWSIEYVRNNPQTSRQSTKRRSSRFSSQRSLDVEEVDRVLNDMYLQVINGQDDCDVAFRGENDTNAWMGKLGPASKPELLACIKYDGNKAGKICANANFTQFNTIDDEGVYYHLTLCDRGAHKIDDDDATFI